jgi:hypothetical protein
MVFCLPACETGDPMLMLAIAIKLGERRENVPDFGGWWWRCAFHARNTYTILTDLLKLDTLELSSDIAVVVPWSLYLIEEL